MLFILMLFIINFVAVNLGQDGKIADEESKKEAERLWELAIEAKGGRERLESVSNMVVSGENPLYLLGFRVRRNRQPKFATLYVFPNKYWEWNDNRPSIFGLSVSMRDYENDKTYVFGDNPEAFSAPCQPDTEKNGPQVFLDTCLHSIIKQKDGRAWGQKQMLFVPQVITFMETKWIKPIPVKASKGYLKKKWVEIIEPNEKKKRKKLVDIIQTKVLDGRVDFVLDAQTHLPIRIGFFMRWYANSANDNDEQVNTDEVYWVSEIDKYTEVDGIQVPYSKGVDIQIDVDYDKTIFSTPTKIEDGSEAWRPKK
jgi:hypothetical protein